jgi:hypothetical protein
MPILADELLNEEYLKQFAEKCELVAGLMEFPQGQRILHRLGDAATELEYHVRQRKRDSTD